MRSTNGRHFWFISLVVLLLVALYSVNLQTCSAKKNADADAGHSSGKNDKMSDPIVVMDTTKGTIKMEIFEQGAPKTAANFLDLVRRGFYNGLTFHRYEPNFVIQGGDPKGNGTGGFIDPQTKQERNIPLEKNPKLRHDSAGVVAMARSNDPNSASCQFYITLAPATFLDNPPGYAVFGKVIEGMDAVMALRAGDKMTKVSELKPAAK